MNNFCKSKSITKKIDLGEGPVDVTFYALPFGTILKMKTAGKSVSKFVATLMTDRSKDVAIETVSGPSSERDANGEAYVNSDVTQSEITPTLASFRHKQLTESIDGLIESITSPDTLEMIGEMITKSARDIFEPGDAKDFQDNMDLGTVIQLLRGALEASAGGIEGLGKFLPPQVKQDVAGAMGKVAGIVSGENQ